MTPNEAVVHVIDDDEAIRESLAFLLESADLDVRTYESANKFLEAWQGAVLAKIAVLVFIIVFIQKRPQGLFAVKGRSIEA